MWLAVIAVLLVLPRPAEGQVTPDDVLRRARAALGGERWDAIRALRVTGIGFSNALEQSERPEGPWLKVFEQFDELRDLELVRLRRTVQSRSAVWGREWSPPLALVADTGAALWERGGRRLPARAAERDAAAEALLLGPERVLATAAAAPDLRAMSDTAVAGVRNHRLGFGFGGRRAELLIDANTGVPTGYVLRGPSARAFDRAWGDVTRAVWYALWSFDPPGVRYPRMIVEELNGQPLREVTLTSVAFEAQAPPDSFGITDSLRAAFRALTASVPSLGDARLGRSFRGEALSPVEPAEGVTVLPGPWYAALIRQNAGVVVVEAPIGPGYSAQVLAEAARRYPGVPVTGLVTTSDAWPHLAGVREYVARGLVIHHLDLNAPILERLVAASWASEPDSLERVPTQALWRPIARRTTLGDGPNRLEIIPVRGEGAERMMLVWLPGRRLLYASDLIQRQPDGTFFWPEYLLEVVEAVARERLDVETVWAMHADPLPWRDVVAAVEGIRGGPLP